MILSLPIILRQGFPVHVEKVPISHFCPAFDKSLTFGMRRADENPALIMGNSVAK